MPSKKILVSSDPITVTVQDHEGGVSTSTDYVIYPCKNFKSDLLLKKLLSVLGALGLMSFLGLQKDGEPKEGDTPAPRSNIELLLTLIDKAPAQMYSIAGLVLLSNKEIMNAVLTGDDALDKLVAVKSEDVRLNMGKGALGAIVAAGIEAMQLDDFFGRLRTMLAPAIAFATGTTETPVETPTE